VAPIDAGAGATTTAESIEFAPLPPITRKYWPCSDCHEDEDTDRTPRKLKREHRKLVMNHPPETRWCLDCHDTENRDKLRLLNGTLLDYADAPKVCAQCHAQQHRDWTRGIHGKRTGQWDGAKISLRCGNCHDAHDPRFKPIAPRPPPTRPDAIR